LSKETKGLPSFYAASFSTWHCRRAQAMAAAGIPSKPERNTAVAVAFAGSGSTSGGAAPSAHRGSSCVDSVEPFLMERIASQVPLIRESIAVFVLRLSPVLPFNFGDALRLCPPAALHVALVGDSLERVATAVEANKGIFAANEQLWRRLGAAGVLKRLQQVVKLTLVRALDLRWFPLCDEGSAQLAAVLPLCGHLQEVNLQCCRIAGEGGMSLLRALGGCLHLQNVDLTSNGFGNEGAAILFPALTRCPHLHSLLMDGNLTRNPAALEFSAALGSLRALSTLVCSFADLKPDGAAALCAAFQYIPFLSSFTLRYSRIGDGEGVTLCTSLPPLKMRKLDLRHCRLGKMSALALKTRLLSWPLLEELVLSGNAIADEGAVAVAAGLATTPRLRVLRLGTCGFGVEGCLALAPVLAHHVGLEELELSHNVAGGEGGVALAAAVGGNLQLRVCEVDALQLGNDAALLFLHSLRASSCLKRLSFSRNGLAEGAQRVGSQLQSWPLLSSLNLEGNPLGDVGAVSIGGALRSGSSARLTALCLAGCEIGDEGVLALLLSLEGCPRLLSLDLSANPYSPATVQPTLTSVRASHPRWDGELEEEEDS
jgi:Ran GTPase-activating protein (RanGAP) involved in mRNA processing and transport